MIQVQVHPCNNYLKEDAITWPLDFLQDRECSYRLCDVGIEDESINQSLSKSEVQREDDEHKHNTSCCKEHKECKRIIIWTWNASR